MLSDIRAHDALHTSRLVLNGYFKYHKTHMKANGETLFRPHFHVLTCKRPEPASFGDKSVAAQDLIGLMGSDHRVMQRVPFLRAVNERCVRAVAERWDFSIQSQVHSELAVDYNCFTEADQRKFASHMLHISTESPGMVAFTPDEASLLRGRETKVRLGRYLTREWSHILPEARIKDLVERFAVKPKALELRLLDNNDPKWAGNEDALGDEWVNLYQGVAVEYSCMRHGVPSQSVAAYGLPGNNLGLVYGEFTDTAGDVHLMGRSIVNTVKKFYVRPFPYDGGSVAPGLNLTVDALGAMIRSTFGYELGRDKALEGVRLRKLHADDHYRRVYCPYLDGVGRVDLRADDLLITSSGDCYAQRTDGFLEDEDEDEDDDDEERLYCQHCEEWFDEDADGGTVNGDWTCQHCLDSDYVWVECCVDYMPIDEVTWVECREQHYPSESVCEHDLSWCDECDEWVEDSDTVRSLDPRTGHESRLICSSCAGEHYFLLDESEYDENLYTPAFVSVALEKDALGLWQHVRIPGAYFVGSEEDPDAEPTYFLARDVVGLITPGVHGTYAHRMSDRAQPEPIEQQPLALAA